MRYSEMRKLAAAGRPFCPASRNRESPQTQKPNAAEERTEEGKQVETREIILLDFDVQETLWKDGTFTYLEDKYETRLMIIEPYSAGRGLTVIEITGTRPKIDKMSKVLYNLISLSIKERYY